MRYWCLDRPASSGQLDLSRATGLMAAIGCADATSFAGAVPIRRSVKNNHLSYRFAGVQTVKTFINIVELQTA
jgi:hypothetical protein